MLARHRLSLLLALALSISALAGVVSPALADDVVPEVMYFPWVPNGAMLGTMGPFYGAVTVQNIEGDAVTLYFRTTTSATATPRPLIPYASYTLSADELGVPAPGSGVNLWTVKEDNSSGRLAATLKVSSPVSPQVPAFEARTSNAHVTVDGHTGMDQHYLVAEHVLPIVQTNSGWNTVIRATNVQPQSTADITVDLIPKDGGNPITFTEPNVAPGTTATFDLLARGVPLDFVGAARITRYNAGGNVPVGRVIAIAERYKASTNMLLINPAQPLEFCTSGHFAPLVFDNYFSWNTGISIVDDSGQTNDVTVTIYRTDGTVASETPLSIPPYGMDFIYTPASGGAGGFVGAAVIDGTSPLCAMVDEVKYTGDQPDVGHAMSYPTTGKYALAGEQLVLPLAQRGTVATGQGDTTGIQLYNPHGVGSIYVDVEFRNQMGTSIVLTEQVIIPALSSATVYAMGIALPNDFQGSALLTVYGGSGRVVAVSNNVNYAVQFDGSASFPLIHAP